MLRLSGLRKAYGALVAVDDLSLDVRPGEIFALLGPNGAGKTTTVLMTVGLLAPDAGTIAIGEWGAPTVAAARRRVGLAPQALAFYEQLTAEENLRLFGTLFDLHGAELATRIETVLGVVGLADRRHDRAATYSGGMKRRLNLAIALVHDPDLLLLDEPTVGVDPQSRNHILESLEALRRGGKTIVYTTHYMEEVERICDRVAIVDHGRILASGTLGEILATHGGESALLVERPGTPPSRHPTADPVGLLAGLAKTGPISHFSLERPSLEDVFLKLTGRHLRDE